MRHLFSSFGLPLLSYTVTTPPDLRRDEMQTYIYTRNLIFLVGCSWFGQSGHIAGDDTRVRGSPGRDRGAVLAAVGQAYNKVGFIRFFKSYVIISVFSFGVILIQRRHELLLTKDETRNI